MRTCYVFQSQSSPDLRGFTDTPEGNHLPAENGPWTLVRTIRPEEPWDMNIHRAIVSALKRSCYALTRSWSEGVASRQR